MKKKSGLQAGNPSNISNSNKPAFTEQLVTDESLQTPSLYRGAFQGLTI